MSPSRGSQRSAGASAPRSANPARPAPAAALPQCATSSGLSTRRLCALGGPGVDQVDEWLTARGLELPDALHGETASSKVFLELGQGEQLLRLEAARWQAVAACAIHQGFA